MSEQTATQARKGAAGRIVFGAGHGIAGTIYGTIVVMAIVAAGSTGVEGNAWRLTTVVAGTVVVLWLAHVYAHAIAESVSVDRRLSPRGVRAIAAREAAIPLAAIAPTAALLLGALDVLEERTAVRFALAIGVVTLGIQGLRYARVERLGRAGSAVAFAVNVMLGLVIVALEVLVAH